MNFNFFLAKPILHQLLTHVVSGDDQPVTAFVQLDLFTFGGVAYPSYGKTGAAVAGKHRAAKENTVKRGRPAADRPVERIVFIAPHAIEVVVVNHSHDRNSGG